jgi:hypothetical protein
MRIVRLLAGILLGLAVVTVTWYEDWVRPPEAVARRVAAFAATYPGPVGEAALDPIECPPLPRLRVYLVCTESCNGVRRLIAVKGLQADLLANLNRTPPESLETTRHRINAVIGREGVRLDVDGAREMIGFFLRLEGLRPQLLLPTGGAEDVEAARAAGDDAMQRLAESLDTPGAMSRVHVEESREGFGAEMLYWDTWRAGRPVLRLRVRVARDGQLRELSAMQPAPRPVPAPTGGPDGDRDGAAGGSTDAGTP